jgi:hypothetical protein
MAVYSLGVEIPPNTTVPTLIKRFKGVRGIVTRVYVDVAAGVGYMSGFFIDYAGVRIPTSVSDNMQYFSGDDSEYSVSPNAAVNEGDVAIYGVNNDSVSHRFWLIIEVQERGHGV